MAMRARLTILGVALLLYAVACALRVMWMGGMGIFFGQLAWFAHLPAFVAVITLLIGLRHTTMVLSLVAALIALNMLAFPGTEIYLDEGGVNKAHILSLGPAAWIWLASLLTLAVGAALAKPVRDLPVTR